MNDLPLNIKFIAQSHNTQIIKTSYGWSFLKENGQGYTLSDDYLRMPRSMQEELFDCLKEWLEDEE